MPRGILRTLGIRRLRSQTLPPTFPFTSPDPTRLAPTLSSLPKTHAQITLSCVSKTPAIHSQRSLAPRLAQEPLPQETFLDCSVTSLLSFPIYPWTCHRAQTLASSSQNPTCPKERFPIRMVWDLLVSTVWLQAFQSNLKCPVGRKPPRAAETKCEGMLLWAQHPFSSPGESTMSVQSFHSSPRG